MAPGEFFLFRRGDAVMAGTLDWPAKSSNGGGCQGAVPYLVARDWEGQRS